MRLKFKFRADSPDDLPILAAMLQAAANADINQAGITLIAGQKRKPFEPMARTEDQLGAEHEALPEIPPVTEEPKKRRAAAPKTEKSKETPVEESKAETTPGAAQPTPEGENPAAVTAERVTLEMIREAITKNANSGKRDATLELLKTFLPDSEPRATNLTPAQYADFYAQVQAL